MARRLLRSRNGKGTPLPPRRRGKANGAARAAQLDAIFPMGGGGLRDF